MATPKPDHPWGFKARHNIPTTQNGDSRPSIKPLQIFLTELTENWNSVEVNMRYRGRYDRFILIDLPDHVIADWFIQMLRKYQHGKQETEEIFE